MAPREDTLRSIDEPAREWMTHESEWRAGVKHHATNKCHEELKRAVMDMCRARNLHQVDLLSPAKERVTDREYWAQRRLAIREVAAASTDSIHEPPAGNDFLRARASRAVTMSSPSCGPTIRRILGTKSTFCTYNWQVGKTGNEEVDVQNEESKYVNRFTKEQVDKAAAAKTPEELRALAKEEGVDLTDDQLEAISGGDAWGTTVAFISECPQCGNYDVEFWYTDSYGDRIYKCTNCGNIIKD